MPAASVQPLAKTSWSPVHGGGRSAGVRAADVVGLVGDGWLARRSAAVLGAGAVGVVGDGWSARRGSVGPPRLGTTKTAAAASTADVPTGHRLLCRRCAASTRTSGGSGPSASAGCPSVGGRAVTSADRFDHGDDPARSELGDEDLRGWGPVIGSRQAFADRPAGLGSGLFGERRRPPRSIRTSMDPMVLAPYEFARGVGRDYVDRGRVLDGDGWSAQHGCRHDRRARGPTRTFASTTARCGDVSVEVASEPGRGPGRRQAAGPATSTRGARSRCATRAGVRASRRASSEEAP